MNFLSKTAFRLILLLPAFAAYSQNSTGINNTSPSSKAALDVRNSPGKQQGILVPRLRVADTTALKVGVTSADQGLLFYDTVNNHYWFWNSLKWVSIGNSTSTGIGILGLGSTNTVPYWTSTGNLGFSNLQYNGLGSFGLGVPASTSYLLQARNSSVNPSFYIRNDGTGAALWAYNSNVNGTAFQAEAAIGGSAGIFRGGNVGIGTNDPVSLLHIYSPLATVPASSGSGATGLVRLSLGDSPMVLDMGVADDAYTGAWLQTHYAANAAVNGPILLNPNGGNVGIGMTSTPILDLEIDGGASDSDIHLFNTASGSGGNNGLRINFSGSTNNVNFINYEAGPIYFGTTAANRMMITSTGLVGIGTISPVHRLDVVGNIGYTGILVATSDIRYKENILPLDHVLSSLTKIRGVYYTWKKEEYKELEFTDDRQIGVIAQEMETIYPELVFTNEKGYKSVDYPKLSPILLQAIKEQQTIIDSLTQAGQRQQMQLDQLKGALQRQQMQLDEQNAFYNKQARPPLTASKNLH